MTYKLQRQTTNSTSTKAEPYPNPTKTARWVVCQLTTSGMFQNPHILGWVSISPFRDMIPTEARLVPPLHRGSSFEIFPNLMKLSPTLTKISSDLTRSPLDLVGSTIQQKPSDFSCVPPSMRMPSFFIDPTVENQMNFQEYRAPTVSEKCGFMLCNSVWSSGGLPRSEPTVQSYLQYFLSHPITICVG